MGKRGPTTTHFARATLGLGFSTWGNEGQPQLNDGDIQPFRWFSTWGNEGQPQRYLSLQTVHAGLAHGETRANHNKFGQGDIMGGGLAHGETRANHNDNAPLLGTGIGLAHGETRANHNSAEA